MYKTKACLVIQNIIDMFQFLFLLAISPILLYIALCKEPFFSSVSEIPPQLCVGRAVIVVD